MKTLIFLLLSFPLTLLAYDYPIRNFTFEENLSSMDILTNDNQLHVVVFDTGACLDHINVDRLCFLFEKKLDYFLPSYNGSPIVIHGYDVYLNYGGLSNQFQITKYPTVLFFYNGQQVERLESPGNAPLFMPITSTADVARVNWEDTLVQQVLKVMNAFRYPH